MMTGANATDAGPVALVTGAGRGIGAATVRRLVDDGWSVVAVDICRDDPDLSYHLGSEADLDSVVAYAPERIEGAVADVRDPDALAIATDRALERFGSLDAAIAAAGIIAGGARAWETAEAPFRAQIEVNLIGVWNLARATIPRIIESPRRANRVHQRRFVGVASTAGVKGLDRLSGYVASKHGVIGLIRSLAIELAPYQMTANAICPGSTRTAVLDESATIYDLDDPEEFAHHHLIERLIEPEEVAAMIAMVCSPSGAAITGAVLPVDAGMLAR